MAIDGYHHWNIIMLIVAKFFEQFTHNTNEKKKESVINSWTRIIAVSMIQSY